MTIALLILGLVLFISLVVIHEFGHFIMARRNGVDVEEFGIFFPPRLYKKRTKGGWDFTINALPLGGFVKMRGEHDSDTDPGSFGAASLWAKTKIMAAGVVLNLVTAIILLTFLALIGMPQLIENQYQVKKDSQLVTSKIFAGYIEPGSPADKAGIKSKDVLKDIAQPGYSPVGITSADKLPGITKGLAGKEVKLFYERDGKPRVTSLKLRSTQEVEQSRKTNNPKGYLGISPSEYSLRRSTWSAPIVAVGVTKQFTELTFKGLGTAVAGLGKTIAGLVTGNTPARQKGQTEASSQVGGPIAIFFALQSGSELGIQLMLMIIAILSLTLAIMNILPIPALDGGRLWFTLIAHAIKKPLSAKFEENLNVAGFLLLIGLIVLITFVDIRRFF